LSTKANLPPRRCLLVAATVSDHVVLATGALQRSKIPVDVATPRHIDRLIAADYRRPGELARNGVLIVRSGETGSQMAEEVGEDGPRGLAIGRPRLGGRGGDPTVEAPDGELARRGRLDQRRERLVVPAKTI
jgi:cation diffusion facilitator CzcD-associated flavoprotein CzcO